MAETTTNLVGMAVPFRRTGASDFHYEENDAAIKSNVILVLTTPIGFLPWRPEFGSKLSTLRHSLNTALLREAARVHVQECLGRWCPYVRVLDVRVTTTPGTKALKIGLDYQVIRNNSVAGPIVPVSFTIQAS